MFSSPRTGSTWDRARAGRPRARLAGRGEDNPRGGAAAERPRRAPHRRAVHAERTANEARRMGIKRRVGELQRRPTAGRPTASTTSGSWPSWSTATLIPPGAEFSFNRTTGRADGREGVPRGAGDHQRRASDRPRRRHVPGLHDGVQRRVRGRAPDLRPRRTTRSTSATTRPVATRRSTTRTSTCASSTTRASGCSCARSSVRRRSRWRSTGRGSNRRIVIETAPLRVTAGRP